MAITNYLPTFAQVEMNRSAGLGAGHVLSQNVLDPTSDLIVEKNGTEFLENGVIVGLNSDLTLGAYDADTHNIPFIVFTEELNTFMSGLKYFATEEDADGEIYPRAVALYVGDVWTTDKFEGDVTDGFATVVGGVIHTQATQDGETTEGTTTQDSIFAVEESTTPNGDPAIRVTYLG